ncbi:MAG: rhomboid family intramembrane serine protease [Chitinophagaceae bacterium]
MNLTLIIVLVTCLVSFVGFSNQRVIDDLIFYPPAVSNRNQWYRFFTCGFIHADLGHLIFNMLSLYFFGKFVEDAFISLLPNSGKWLYLLMYLSALMASILPTYNKNKDNYNYRSLGASGAVSAVIFAGLLLSPTTGIYMYFIPIPIPGFIFAPLYLLISAMMDRRGGDNINHSAHIWGAIYGLAFVVVLGRVAHYPVIESCIEQIKVWLNWKFG